jgi:hypothetical protein
MNNGSPVDFHKRRGGRKRTVSSVKAACDRLWSQLVRASAGHRCERCLIPGRLEAHHAYGRTNHRLRWESRNGVSLCHACHRWAEHFPLEFTDWFRETRPDDAEWLVAENRKGLLRRTLDDYLDLERDLLRQLNAVDPPPEEAAA